jgi:hypothetical protein
MISNGVVSQARIRRNSKIRLQPIREYSKSVENDFELKYNDLVAVNDKSNSDILTIQSDNTKLLSGLQNDNMYKDNKINELEKKLDLSINDNQLVETLERDRLDFEACKLHYESELKIRDDAYAELLVRFDALPRLTVKKKQNVTLPRSSSSSLNTKKPNKVVSKQIFR